MKKVWLNGWFEKNLGDDLFLKIIVDRYKNVEFSMTSTKNYSNIENKCSNLTCYNHNFKNLKSIKRFIKNMRNNIACNNRYIPMDLVENFDCSVLISGSYFMEQNNYSGINNLITNIKTDVPYYILGVNYGPYHTNKYLEDCKTIFSNAQDVCFRDDYSYNIFSSLKNVRLAPDIVFGLELPKAYNKILKKVVFSVCNIEKNGKNKYISQNEYENGIVEMIDFFYKLGYQVTLMSFSKSEGDEKVIKSIKKKTTAKISTYFYRGNIDRALKELMESEIIIGTRYHANILGMIMDKTVIPIAYSKKTVNVLNDIKFEGKIFDLTTKDGFNFKNLAKTDLNYKLNVSKIVKKSKEHFKHLDRFLN